MLSPMFISGPHGLYNTAKVRRAYSETATKGGKPTYRYYVEMDDDTVYEIHKPSYVKLEIHDGVVLPGSGLCKYCILPHD